MRAAVVAQPGPVDAIEIIDIPVPVPAPGEIRVRVAVAGVNPVDVNTRAGHLHALGMIAHNDPIGLGWEAAGVVTAAGAETTFTVGERVALLSWGIDRPLGAYAEEVVVPTEAAATIPDGLSFADAATVPLNALTALQALDLLGEPAGRHLLITGAAGAVGGYAVNLAARRGWHVTALARDTDHDFVTSQGAVRLITDLAGTYDAVFDPAVLQEAAVAVAADGGHYVGVMSALVPDGGGRVQTESVLVRADGDALARLLTQTAAGDLPVRLHATLPFDEASQAHKALEAGGVRGRYILTF